MLDSRTRRRLVDTGDLETFEVRVEELEIHAAAERDLSGLALSAIHRIRGMLFRFTEMHPDFSSALDPYPKLHREWPHEIQAMIRAGRQAGTGPMASVNGCISEFIGKAILSESNQAIVEASGDVFLATDTDRIVTIQAGDSPHSFNLGLKVPSSLMPLSVCTSSGTSGGNLSFGLCDAALVVAQNSVLADAAATALGNRITKPYDLAEALDWIMSIEDIIGAVAIIGHDVAVRGDAIELVDI